VNTPNTSQTSEQARMQQPWGGGVCGNVVHAFK